MQMGQTRIAPLKEEFFAESRHFFAVLLDVTQEKITQSQRKRPFRRVHIGIYTVLKESFPPQQPPVSLEYIQYSCGPRCLLWRKIFSSKLRSTPKREIFSEDQAKNHGKADACRGFLMQYYEKRSGLERINPYAYPPFGMVFLFLCMVLSGYCVSMARRMSGMARTLLRSISL